MTIQQIITCWKWKRKPTFTFVPRIRGHWVPTNYFAICSSIWCISTLSCDMIEYIPYFCSMRHLRDIHFVIIVLNISINPNSTDLWRIILPSLVFLLSIPKSPGPNFEWWLLSKVQSVKCEFILSQTVQWVTVSQLLWQVQWDTIDRLWRPHGSSDTETWDHSW